MRALVLLAVFAGCGDNLEADCQAWRQWGNDASHVGDSCVSAQPLQRVVDDMIYDSFTPLEEIDAGGDLVLHYQSPLIDGDDVYMMTKTGTYTPCDVGSGGIDCSQADEMFRLNTQVWTEQGWSLATGKLTQRWSYDSDWTPEPQVGFEPMFQPALDGDLIAIPGAGGALWELDRATGHVSRHVTPFGALDPDTYVAGGLAVTLDGTIYYNAIKLDHDLPYNMPVQAWLVVVAPDGSTRTADYAGLVPGAPVNNDLCYETYDFMTTPLPWPPVNADGTVMLPPMGHCGSQRPGINSTPAIGADGTIFLVTRAHYNERYSYIVALAPDLTPKWATSLRDQLNDACGVTTPSDGTSDPANMFDCRVGTPLGLEQSTGLPPAATVDDQSSASPVALPDGGVLYGTLTGYNSDRGHLYKLDATGAYVAGYDFGWDSTPAVVESGGDYKIVIKDNHYGTDADGFDLGPYYITELDSKLNVVWKFLSTNINSCRRLPDGTLGCVPNHPHGFEWCINAPAVDRDGVTFVNSEDGNVYAINPDGSLRDSLFLDDSEGAAYTPLAIDHMGRSFALNNGHLVVLGGP